MVFLDIDTDYKDEFDAMMTPYIKNDWNQHKK